MGLKFVSKKLFGISGVVLLVLAASLYFVVNNKTKPAALLAQDSQVFMVGGSGTTQAVPEFKLQPVVLADDKVADIAAGGEHVLVLSENGNVYSFGNNKKGQLGFKTDSENVSTPTQINGLPIVKKIAASQSHSMTLTEAQEVWTFGGNNTGQLGTGDNNNSFEPVKVPNLGAVKDIAAGYKFSLALKDDGTVWGWGTSCSVEDKAHALEEWEEHHGQGAASYYNATSQEHKEEDEEYEDCINEEVTGLESKVPEQIQGVSDVKAISGGYGHILLLKNDGTVWAFGCNKFGQLGNGTIANQVSFAKAYQIKELSDITAVAAGFRHSLALKKDGTLYAWGHNDFGELGNNSTVTSGLPIKVEGVSDVKNIYAGHDYTIVQKQDGRFLAWGNNYFNQLGNWGPGFSQIPGEIKELSEQFSIKKVSPGGTILVFLKD